MNAESLIIECGALTVEICLSYLVYNLYKSSAKCLKSLQEAQCFEIDSSLQQKIESNNGVVEYAVISGNTRALSLPIRSQYIPYLQGVIREKITKEHKVKWNPFLRSWSSTTHDLQHYFQHVPFALCSKSSGLFKKQVLVEVLEPLSGQELLLSDVHDEFIPHKDTIGDTVFGFFRGERTVGLQEFEGMLFEDQPLTAVGKLVLENNKLTIKPPDNGLTYFVTPLDLESLIKKISTTTKLYKITSIIMGTITLTLLVYVTRRAFSEIKRRIYRSQELKRLEDLRRQRRMADTSRKEQDANVPKCVVCLEYPVEILILECGHACMCITCSEQVKNLCPVCRKVIQRIVPTFWP